MADYDGKIQLAMDVSPEEAIKSFKKLQSQAQKTFDALSAEKPTKEVEKLETSLSKSVSNGEKLANSLEKASQATIPTEEYTQLKSALTDAEKELSRLVKKQEALSEKHSMSPVMDQYQKLVAQQKQYEQDIQTQIGLTGEHSNAVTILQGKYDKVSEAIEKIRPKIEAMYAASDKMDAKVDAQKEKVAEVTAEMNKMVQAGTAFKPDTTGIEEAKNALVDANNQIRLNQESLARMHQSQSQAAQEEAQRVREETDAMAQQVAKMLEIHLNAGQINSEIGETVNKLNEVNSQLDQVRSRMSDLEQAGAGLGYEEYDHLLAVEKQLVEQQAQLNGELDAYRDKMTNMQEPISVWERVKNLFKQIGTDIAHPIQAMQRLKAATEETGNSAEKAAGKFSKFSGIVKGIGGVLGNIGNALKSLAQRFLHAGNSSQSFDQKLKKGIWIVLKYGVGIRSLYALFRKLRSAISESLSTMAVMNGGVNQTNAALSSLVSSLNYLKGSLGAAFAPILTVVTPILSNFMNQLAGVINYIGMFIAKLTGAKSYMRATFKPTNYAAGTSSGKKQQSAQEKYDEAVKKAQEKYEKDLAKTQEKNAKAVAKAEEKEAKAADKLAKAQKKANEQLSGLDKLNVIDGIDDMTDSLENYEATLTEEPELKLPDMEDYFGGAGGDDPFGLEEVALDSLEWDWGAIQAKAEKLGRDLADKLNKIFADEDLAKNIGHNIAEALNTVVDFLYGFIDQFNWRQAGRWLGSLIQEGLETFDWAQAGETLGKLINGLADYIIGFFERYQVGTLGRSIATFLNNAIKTVDPNKLGEAVVDVLKAPLIELTELLKATNWKEAGKKFSDFLHKVLTSDELDGKTLGQDVGEFLKAVVDAAIDFIKGMDKSQLVSDIGQFFGDIFASGGVETKILAAIGGWKLLGGGQLVTAILGSAVGWKAASSLFKQAGKSMAEGATEMAAGAKVAKGATDAAAGGAKAAAATAEAAGAGATGAATAATAALGVFDAAIVAYDVGKLVQVHNEWETADDEHQKAVENYCNSLETLYNTAGQKAVDAYAGKKVDMEALYAEWQAATGENKTQLGIQLDELTKIYQDAGNEAVSAVAGTNTTLQEEQEKARQQYEEMPHNMWEGFIAGWNTYFGEGGKGLGQLAKDAFSEMVTTIKGLLKIGSPSKVMEDIGTDTVTGLDRGLKFDKVISTAKSNITKLLSTFRSSLGANQLVSVGMNLINGLKSGLVSGLNSALSTVTSICSRIVSAARSAFQIHSPSKVFADIGENLMLGLAKGTDENADVMDDSFENLVPSQSTLDAFEDKFISTVVDITNTAKALFDDMLDYFESSMNSFSLSPALQNMTTTLPKLAQFRIPDVASGYRLPSNQEFMTSASNKDFYGDIGDIVKNAIIEAITETAGLQDSDENITINIDGKNIFQVVRNENSKYKKQHGTSAF